MPPETVISTKARPIRVLHVITGLQIGGAEMVLYRLLSKMDRMDFTSEVISLTANGPIGERIADLDISVLNLGMTSTKPDPRALVRLARLIQEYEPYVIQSWMYHADLMAGIANIDSGVPLIWGVRHARLDPERAKSRTIKIARLCARLSNRLPERILYCSESARAFHEELGYAREKKIVIPNGFDLTQIKPNLSARVELRSQIGLPHQAPIIGLVARYDPEKDHHNFVSAAGLLASQYPQAHFVLCGKGINWDNDELVEWIDSVRMRDRFHLLDNQEDTSRITAGFDIAALSSATESFPNVVGEAMACGVPCVVTDVGDAALIVGDTGLVVPPRNPEAMAAAWMKLLNLPEEARKELGERARERIAANYSLDTMVKRYEELYQEVAGVRINRLH